MRRVLITGALGGLGKALTEMFDRYGIHLFLLCRGVRHAAWKQHTWFEGDLTDFAFIKKLQFFFEAEEEGLDVLINNAGNYLAKPFDQMSLSDIQNQIALNLIAPIQLTRVLWESLKKRKGIVFNINSLAGKGGAVGETLYGAAKHGLSGFSKSLQFDGTRDDVRVVNVTLGAMKTPMSNKRENWENFISPEEVADVLFSLWSNQKSLRITEIELNRSRY